MICSDQIDSWTSCSAWHNNGAEPYRVTSSWSLTVMKQWDWNSKQRRIEVCLPELLRQISNMQKNYRLTCLKPTKFFTKPNFGPNHARFAVLILWVISGILVSSRKFNIVHCLQSFMIYCFHYRWTEKHRIPEFWFKKLYVISAGPTGWPIHSTSTVPRYRMAVMTSDPFLFYLCSYLKHANAKRGLDSSRV